MIIEEAMRWLGVPFRHQGRDHSGVDCAGLVIRVGQICGVLGELPQRVNRYGVLPNPRHIEALLDELGERVTRVQPGDVIWFGHPRVTTHLGLWTGAEVIHADGRIGRVIRHRLCEPVRAVFRYPGVH